ncbi:MAG: endolytic transglycosylase MltG [Clostridiales bacterium]|nr:endolytic transglycosylase MltG [Clostridiales bacterium]
MKRFLYILTAGLIVIVAAGVMCYRYATQEYSGSEKRLYVSAGLGVESLEKMLADSLGEDYGKAVFRLWNLRKGSLKVAHGSYVVKPGETSLAFARRLRGGMQDPVKVVVPNVRTLCKAVDIISSNFEFDSASFMDALVAKGGDAGMRAEEVESMLVPDTYEFYWTASPQSVVDKLYDRWNKFWNEKRRAKAAKLGLTPVQISVLASIVEEESNKREEHPVIARLYLNRLARGMKLQADPTVKYAVGDPALRRILNRHLTVDSPYNTYINTGLPPGPIRIVDAVTLDAVLNAPNHDYLYMCAKEDFSGYHNFARTLSEHNANASRYHAALSKLKK